MRRALLFLTLMLFSAVIAETTVTVFKTTAEKEYLIPLKVVSDTNAGAIVEISLPNAFLGTSFAGKEFYGLAPAGTTGFEVTVTALDSSAEIEIYKPAEVLDTNFVLNAGTSKSVSLTADGGYFRIVSSSPVTAFISGASETQNNMRFIPAKDGRLIGSEFVFNAKNYGRQISFVSDKDADITLRHGAETIFFRLKPYEVKLFTIDSTDFGDYYVLSSSDIFIFDTPQASYSAITSVPALDTKSFSGTSFVCYGKPDIISWEPVNAVKIESLTKSCPGKTQCGKLCCDVCVFNVPVYGCAEGGTDTNYETLAYGQTVHPDLNPDWYKISSKGKISVYCNSFNDETRHIGVTAGAGLGATKYYIRDGCSAHIISEYGTEISVFDTNSNLIESISTQGKGGIIRSYMHSSLTSENPDRILESIAPVSVILSCADTLGDSQPYLSAVSTIDSLTRTRTISSYRSTQSPVSCDSKTLSPAPMTFGFSGLNFDRTYILSFETAGNDVSDLYTVLIDGNAVTPEVYETLCSNGIRKISVPVPASSYSDTAISVSIEKVSGNPLFGNIELSEKLTPVKVLDSNNEEVPASYSDGKVSFAYSLEKDTNYFNIIVSPYDLFPEQSNQLALMRGEPAGYTYSLGVSSAKDSNAVSLNAPSELGYYGIIIQDCKNTLCDFRVFPLYVESLEVTSLKATSADFIFKFFGRGEAENYVCSSQGTCLSSTFKPVETREYTLNVLARVIDAVGTGINLNVKAVSADTNKVITPSEGWVLWTIPLGTVAKSVDTGYAISVSYANKVSSALDESPAVEFSNAYISSSADSNVDYNRYLILSASVMNSLFDAPADNAYVNAKIIDSDSNTIYEAATHGRRGLTDYTGTANDIVFDSLALETGTYKVCISSSMIQDAFGITNSNGLCVPLNIWHSITLIRNALLNQYEISSPISWNYYSVKDSAGNEIPNPSFSVKWKSDDTVTEISNNRQDSYTIPCGSYVFSNNQLIVDVSTDSNFVWPSQEIINFELAAKISTMTATAVSDKGYALTDRVRNYDNSRIVLSLTSIKDVCGSEILQDFPSSQINLNAGDNNPADNNAGQKITSAVELISHATGNKRYEKTFTVYGAIPESPYLSSNYRSHVYSFSLSPDTTTSAVSFKDEYIFTVFPYTKSFTMPSTAPLWPTYLIEIYGFNLKPSCTTLTLNSKAIPIFSESNDRRWNYSYAVVDKSYFITGTFGTNQIYISSTCPGAVLKEISIGKSILNSQPQLNPVLAVFDTKSSLIDSNCYDIVPSGCTPSSYSAGELMKCTLNINAKDTNGCYWERSTKLIFPARVISSVRSVTTTKATQTVYRKTCSAYGATTADLSIAVKDARDSNVARGTISYSIPLLSFTADSNLDFKYTFSPTATPNSYSWTGTPKIDYFHPTTLKASGKIDFMGCFQPFALTTDTDKWYASGDKISVSAVLKDDLGTLVLNKRVIWKINSETTTMAPSTTGYSGTYTVPEGTASGKLTGEFLLDAVIPHYYNSARNTMDVTVNKLTASQISFSGTTNSYTVSGNINFEYLPEPITCSSCMNMLINDVLYPMSYASILSNKFALTSNAKLNTGENKFTAQMIPEQAPHKFGGSTDITANIAGVISMSKTRYNNEEYLVSQELPVQYSTKSPSMQLENLEFADVFRVETTGNIKPGSPYIIDELLLDGAVISSSKKEFSFGSFNSAVAEAVFSGDTNIKPGKYSHRVSLYDSNVEGVIAVMTGADFSVFSLLTNVIFKDTDGIELEKENNVYVTTSGQDFTVNLDIRKQTSETMYEPLSETASVVLSFNNPDSSDYFEGAMQCSGYICSITVPWRQFCGIAYSYGISIKDEGVEKNLKGTFNTKCSLAIKEVSANQGALKTKLIKDGTSYVQQSAGDIRLEVTIFEPKLIDSIGTLEITLKDLTTNTLYYSTATKEDCEVSLDMFNLKCTVEIKPYETGCKKFMLDIFVQENTAEPLSARFTGEFYIDDIVLSASYNNLMMFGTENKISGNARFCSGRESSFININSEIDEWTETTSPSYDGSFELSYLAGKSGLFDILITAVDTQSSISKSITDTVSVSKTTISIEPDKKIFDVGTGGEKAFLVRIINPSTERQEYELKLVPGGIPSRFSENFKTAITVSVAPEGQYITYIDVLPILLGEDTHVLQVQNINFPEDRRTCIGNECPAAEKALEFTTTTQAIIEKGAFKYAVLDETGFIEIGLILALACFLLFSKFLNFSS